MVIFYGFDPIFWPQWDPIGPKMDPRGPHRELESWPLGPILAEIDDRGVVEKFEFGGMVNFNGFDPFFGPNGTPLAPRWTLRGPHLELAP